MRKVKLTNLDNDVGSNVLEFHEKKEEEAMKITETICELWNNNDEQSMQTKIKSFHSLIISMRGCVFKGSFYPFLEKLMQIIVPYLLNLTSITPLTSAVLMFLVEMTTRIDIYREKLCSTNDLIPKLVELARTFGKPDDGDLAGINLFRNLISMERRDSIATWFPPNEIAQFIIDPGLNAGLRNVLIDMFRTLSTYEMNEEQTRAMIYEIGRMLSVDGAPDDYYQNVMRTLINIVVVQRKYAMKSAVEMEVFPNLVMHRYSNLASNRKCVEAVFGFFSFACFDELLAAENIPVEWLCDSLMNANLKEESKCPAAAAIANMMKKYDDIEIIMRVKQRPYLLEMLKIVLESDITDMRDAGITILAGIVSVCNPNENLELSKIEYIQTVISNTIMFSEPCESTELIIGIIGKFITDARSLGNIDFLTFFVEAGLRQCIEEQLDSGSSGSFVDSECLTELLCMIDTICE